LRGAQRRSNLDGQGLRGTRLLQHWENIVDPHHAEAAATPYSETL
jgi:hypothetical protein